MNVMGKSVKIIAWLVVLVLVASVALAAPKGNPKKGKYLFKKTCKVCHVEGAEGGKLTPLAKTQAQWDRFFEKTGHKANPAILDDLGDKKKNDIWKFLYDHAADSPQPQTCG